MRIGTRGSALALAQAHWVADRLEGSEVVVLRTSGDDGATGDKSRWVDTIEAALVGGEIDLAVHSAKDVPGDLAPGTEIVATPERETPYDLLVGREAIDDLDESAAVGTSSLRRQAQLLARRPDLRVVAVRGNVDTRLRKLADGEVDALVLAAAGVRRLGLRDGPLPAGRSGLAHLAEEIDDPLFVPAPGQGTLALQARTGDNRATSLNHAETFACLAAERAAVRVLEADCHTPVGVHAAGGRMRGFVGRPDGSAWVTDEIASYDGEELGRRLLAAGARELLA